MTTLPQTTTLRLPRPASNSQLSLQGGGAPIGVLPAQAAGSGSQMSGADMWRVIRANSWLIILLVLVGAAAGYFTNSWLLKYHPKYTASAWVSISAPAQLDPLKGESSGMENSIVFQQQQKMHAQLLKNESLFSEVLQDQNSPIRDTGWLRQFRNTSLAKEDLGKSLIVTPSLDTNLIKVEMSYRDSTDCKKIIEAVVDQHIRDQDRDTREKQQKRSYALNNLRQQLDGRHSELSDELNDKQTKLNISGVGGGAGRLNVKDAEMGDLSKMRLEADLRNSEAQDTYNGLVAMISAGQDPPVVTDAVNRDPEVVRCRTFINEIDLRQMTMGDHFGDENPEVQRLRSQKAIFTKKLDKAVADVRASSRANVIEVARHNADSAKVAVSSIGVRIGNLDSEIGLLNKELGDFLMESNELKGIDARLKDVNDQLDQITRYTNQKEVTNLEWKARPEATDIPTFPQLPMTMSLSVAAGLFLSLGIAFARELMDNTVRSPRDITRVGSMNLLGMISHEDDDPQCQGARLPLVIFEAPQSMMAEQLRQVRTRLQHAASLDTTRSILITSPSPDDGKSTIACNLASGLALNGRRILLVDANFRRPSLHRTFNLGNDHGFSDVLNSIELFETAVQETQVPNLYVLPSGLKPTNATELLESQLLMDFIERSLEEFDHVIFDSGPLLFVSETVALAPRVDGVVTVVRARTNTRGVLQRMRDSLRQIKAEHLGVVLNAVRVQGGGYYGRNIRTYYDYQNGRVA